MSKRALGGLCLVASLLVTIPAVLAGQAYAGERGKFRGLSVLLSTKFNEFKAPEGHPYKAALSGELEGLVFNDNKGQFLDKAHYIVQWVGDGAGGGYCMKTFATSPTDKVFARCDSKSTPTGAEGIVTILGGTGRYAGIKGKGTFKVVTVTDRVMWDLLEWDYEVP